MRRAAVCAVAVIAAAGSLAPAAAAAKKKPIKKTYALELSPAPVENILVERSCGSPLRQPGTDVDVQKIKVTGAGTLYVKVSGFTGDWDTALYSPSGAILAEGGGSAAPQYLSTPDAPINDTMAYRAKKAQTFHLRVCNYLGDMNATVTYTFTYS